MPVDAYTPANFAGLYGSDTDLGSTAPAILPSTHATYPHLAIQSGKDGCVRLINLDDMSGAGGPGHAGGELNVGTACSTDAIGNLVFPQPAVWVNPADGVTWAFVANNAAKINGYKLDVSGATPVLSRQWTNNSGGTSPAIANGYVFTAATGIVRALNPLTGAQVWSASIGSINWQTPIVVNSHVYVTDSNAKLWSFPLDGIFKNGFQ
jgi:outer membrane protein assembly factor BamB